MSTSKPKRKVKVYTVFRRDFSGSQWNQSYKDIYIEMYGTYKEVQKATGSTTPISAPSLMYEGYYYKVKEIEVDE